MKPPRSQYGDENQSPVRVHVRVMSSDKLLHRDLTHSIIGAFYEVYNILGFGFLEHI